MLRANDWKQLWKQFASNRQLIVFTICVQQFQRSLTREITPRPNNSGCSTSVLFVFSGKRNSFNGFTITPRFFFTCSWFVHQRSLLVHVFWTFKALPKKQFLRKVWSWQRITLCFFFIPRLSLFAHGCFPYFVRCTVYACLFDLSCGFHSSVGMFA